jgi:large subunit ribosomal protein L4
MKYNIHNLNGKVVSEFNLDDTVFGIDPNQGVVRQAVLAEMTNMRQGTHASKNRALVNGGGKKPFKQKGRGGARAGTIRSPLWKGGGTIFGPEPHSYKHKVPKKVSKLARRSLFSSKVLNGELFIVDSFTIESHKTSNFVTILNNLKFAEKKILILVSAHDDKLDLAVRNLRNVYLLDAKKVSAYDLIDCNQVIIEKASVDILTKLLIAS